MAKLRIPENCSACGVVLMEHDQVVFEREATLTACRRPMMVRRDGACHWGWVPGLQPQIKPTSPKNVRHKVCP